MFDIFSCLSLLGAGSIFLISGLFALQRKRLIENIPTSKIRSLAVGLVEVCGTIVAVPVKTLKSPLTGTRCVYYAYAIISGKSIIDHGSARTQFYVKDETGAVLVDPAGAEISVYSEVFSKPSCRWEELPPAITAHMKGRNFHDAELSPSEETLTQGRSTYVMGTVTSLTGKNGPYKIICKGSNDKTFFISDKSEKELLLSLMTFAVFGILVGGAMLLISLYWLVGPR
jgi:hypothetical protein